MATLKSDLSKIAGRMSVATSEALMQTAEDIYQISQQLVPVDTGALKASGSTDITQIKNGLATKVAIGYGNDDVEYAKYVEYGTSNMEAQPFLTPAFVRAEEIMTVRMKEAAERAIAG